LALEGIVRVCVEAIDAAPLLVGARGKLGARRGGRIEAELLGSLLQRRALLALPGLERLQNGFALGEGLLERKQNGGVGVCRRKGGRLREKQGRLRRLQGGFCGQSLRFRVRVRVRVRVRSRSRFGKGALRRRGEEGGALIRRWRRRLRELQDELRIDLDAELASARHSCASCSASSSSSSSSLSLLLLLKKKKKEEEEEEGRNFCEEGEEEERRRKKKEFM
jgi:hypothetical protein